MLLVTKQDVVQKWAVRGQESTSHLKGLCVPELRFICLNFNLKLFEAAYLFLQLNNEADLGTDAEVPDTEETYSL